MGKDTTIGIRVSKEFKSYLQREAKRKGISLTEYIESHTDDSFKLTQKHLQSLMERTKEDLPTFWREAEKSQITQEFEKFILMIVNDFVNPINRNNPRLHSALMLVYIPLLVKNTIVHIDSIEDEQKRQAVDHFLSAGKSLAENLNKLKVKNKEEQEYIISQIRDMIETFAFSFTSMAFAKDSFVKIKEELDKTAKALLKEVNSK